jgi:molybdopterin converting factor small subunit
MISIQFDSRLLQKPLAADIPSERESHFIIIQAPAGRSVNQTLQDLDIQLSQAVAALVNGQTTDLEELLQPGDHVRLLPQIAGGY